jgi:hypothetical protein
MEARGTAASIREAMATLQLLIGVPAMGWILGLFCLIAAVAVVGGWIRSRGMHYGRMFDDDHFVEFARALAAIKPVVLDNVEDPEAGRVSLPTPADPRTLRTSGDLFLYYTITRQGGRYEHHYSLRDTRGYTAGAVGQGFGVFAALVLGVDPSLLTIERSENTVFHVEFVLDEKQQRAFADRPPLGVTNDNVAALKRQAFDVGRRVGFKHTKIGISFVAKPA